MTSIPLFEEENFKMHRYPLHLFWCHYDDSRYNVYDLVFVVDFMQVLY